MRIFLMMITCFLLVSGDQQSTDVRRWTNSSIQNSRPTAIVAGGKGPSPAATGDGHCLHILSPCTCNALTKEISCRGGSLSSDSTAEQQLSNVFNYYSKSVTNQELRRFNSVYINIRNLTRIKSGIFNGIQFSEILLAGRDLQLIDRDAFFGTEQHVQTLSIYLTSIKNQPERYDFFAAIRSLINLQKLLVVMQNFTEIPDRAFNNPINISSDDGDQSEVDNREERQRQLMKIQITGGQIQTIGTDAFGSLPKLEQIILNKNRINRIKSYAFRMSTESNISLTIDLTDNELNETSFEPNSLIGSKRPVKIHFGLNGCNKFLANLPEDIFRPFLDDNPLNSIDIGRHCFDLQCGCNMSWILSDSYRLRVKNFRCSHQDSVVYFSDFMRNETCPNRIYKASINQTSVDDQTKANEIVDHSAKSKFDNQSKIDPRQLCSTKKCAKQGTELNSYLNRSVDPCDSFYDFACNGWEAKHLLEFLVQMLSNGGFEYDNFVKVELKIQENLKKLLLENSEQPEDSVPVTVPNSVPKKISKHNVQSINNVRMMFTKCVRRTDKGFNQASLDRMLTDIGGWPMLTKKFIRDEYRWEKYFATVINRYYDRIFIELESRIDEDQIKYLMIKSANLIVSRRKLLSVKLDRLESYASYILNTVLYFGGTNHQNETIDEIWQMIKFEKQIADLAKKSMGFEFMIKRPLQTLGCLIPEIDWLYILNNLHRISTNESDGFIETTSMFDVHYLIELSRLLARTDQRIIANYIGWRIMDGIGFLIGGTDFVEIQQNFYKTESREGLKTINKQCLEPLIKSLPYLMSRIYLEHHLSPDARDNARKVVEAVKKSFIESMAKKNWPEEPKRGLIEKVENINLNIGYPDWILDDQQLEIYYNILNYNVSMENETQLLVFYAKVQEAKLFHMIKGIGDTVNKSHDWDPLPLHVGATYDFVGHIISIPMGLLQAPFFEDDRPFYMNFASLGSFFGHEISHSITPRYSEFDKLLPPWNQDFLKDYFFKAHCFALQYTGYYDKDAELRLDGTRTFEEDMSDLAGIQTAYNAYQETAKRMQTAQNNGTTDTAIFPQRIQVIPEFTDEMLFFISFAQKWCRSSSRVHTRIRISKSVHSPEKYRVNGALSNLEAFSRAFDCPVGSPMNPDKRCESW